MRLAAPLAARLEFLSRVAGKECKYLLETDRRLFGDGFTAEMVLSLDADPILAERLDAFVSRFGRLQDTVGDKLLPALLLALAETPGAAIENFDKAERFGFIASPGAAIENFDKAERFGFIASADAWLEMRKLRNQMVHEYIEDKTVLASALRSGHAFVPDLVAAAQRCTDEATRLLGFSRA